MNKQPVLKVAVPGPLFGLFDYLIPETLRHHTVAPGMRVVVPFGRQKKLGIIIEQTNQSNVASERLRPVLSLPDNQAVLPPDIIQLLLWAANYYIHPPGDAIQTALPVYLRQSSNVFCQPEGQMLWLAKSVDSDEIEHLQHRAPKQYQIYQLLIDNPDGLSAEQINRHSVNWHSAIKALVSKNLVQQARQAYSYQHPDNYKSHGMIHELNPAQQAIVDAISYGRIQETENPSVHCLYGVTGSGKTEVYLALSKKCLSYQQQVLILVPEISLTHQLTRRFSQSLQCPIAVLHSGMNNSQRYEAWFAASSGGARVIIGTRSSVFTPLPELGLIIVDEEHDGSYKQQDGFRYNARDLAIIRARQAGCPIVLGSATPSLETLNNINEQRYKPHYLRHRANTRALPSIRLINLCNQRIEEGLSEPLLAHISDHLKQKGQVLLFINRRGFAPLLMCHHCGWTTRCHRCDANMTYHMKRGQLHCHHCDAQRPAPRKCEECDSDDVIAMGSGTERIEHFLQSRFPQTLVSRIDRDTTRNKGALQEKLAQAHSGESGILVGTQMLAKGHDFPGVTLVAILDTDQALFSADFRAAEHLAQLITQVSGRAGRGSRTGEVLIQTHHPEHPLLQTLLHQGYEAFAQSALAERKAADLPPSRHLALIRSEATSATDARAFLEELTDLFRQYQVAEVDIFGPITAPMEKRAGRYRYQLMLQAKQRKPLHQLLHHAIPQAASLKSARKARWSVDVDPYDTF